MAWPSRRRPNPRAQAQRDAMETGVVVARLESVVDRLESAYSRLEGILLAEDEREPRRTTEEQPADG